MTTTTINHAVRRKFELSIYDYVVMSALIEYKGSGLNPHGFVAWCSEQSGISTASVRASMKTLTERELMNKEGYSKWFRAHINLDEVEQIVSKYKQLADTGVTLLNKYTGSSYRPETYYDLFKRILREIPGIEPAHFSVVIEHRAWVWKDNPDMQKYMRPSTIFGSKFKRYLDEAYSEIEKNKKSR